MWGSSVSFMATIAVHASVSAVIIVSANVVPTIDGEPVLRLSMFRSLTFMASLIAPIASIDAHVTIEAIATIPSHQQTHHPILLTISRFSFKLIASHPARDLHHDDRVDFLLVFILIVTFSLHFQYVLFRC